MLAMFLARKHTQAAFSEIGEFFGGRNHSTVMSAVAKVEDWLFCDDPLIEICGGLKMANGTNSRGGSGPDSRMGSAHKQRASFLKAQLEAKKRGLLFLSSFLTAPYAVRPPQASGAS